MRDRCSLCRRTAIAAAVVCMASYSAAPCSAADCGVTKFAGSFAVALLLCNYKVASAHELEVSDDDDYIYATHEDTAGTHSRTIPVDENDLDFSREGKHPEASHLNDPMYKSTTHTTLPEWKTVQLTSGLLVWAIQKFMPASHDREVWSMYWIEAIAALLTILVGWHCYWGVYANRQAACDWLDDALPFFKTQFAKVGFESSFLQSASWSSFVFFATGRQNCRSLTATLEITPRQCMWLYQLIGRMVPSLIEDQVVIEIPLDKMEVSAFAIGRRIDLMRLRRTCQLLDEGSTIRSVPGLPAALVVLSDNIEIVERILTPEFLKILGPREHLLKHFIICDKLVTEHFTKEIPAIHLRLALPSDAADRRESLLLLQCIVASFIDILTHFKLSPRALKEVKNYRLLIEKKVLRENTDQCQHIEAKRAKQKREEEERIERMTPEQGRKWDEKQHKMSLKKRGPKIKMLA